MGCSPWGCKESGTTERLNPHHHTRHLIEVRVVHSRFLLAIYVTYSAVHTSITISFFFMAE